MPQQKDYWSSFISGGLAGICAKTVIAPLERVKILYLTRSTTFTYKDAIHDAKQIYKTHGLSNFWRGNQANILRIFPQGAINFSTFDTLRNRFASDKMDKSAGRRIRLFLCGLTSGIVAQSITYPLDFLRTRLAMQRDNFSYSTIYDAAKKIFQKEGFKGFYSGLSVGVIGIGIYHGSGFFLFTLSKEYLQQHYVQYSQMTRFDFMIGAFGSVIAQVLSYPFDVVKKRMQGQMVLIQEKQITTPLSTIQTVKQIFVNEGLRKGFYKGVSLNFMKGPLSAGTAWSVKNTTNRYLNKNYDF